MQQWAACILFAVSAAHWPFVAAAALEQDGIWTTDATQAARHAQSGFACPKQLVTSRDGSGDLVPIELQDVIVGSGGRAPGEEVGCEYEGMGGSWVTVEIIKLRSDESAESKRDATRARLKKRFPDIMGSADGPQTRLRPTSPTGGQTFAMTYYNAQVGDRRGAVSAVGGEVGGWMITVIQFDYEKDGQGLKYATTKNWQTIASSRR